MKTILLLITILLFTSCMSHRHDIGLTVDEEQMKLKEDFGFYEEERLFYALSLAPINSLNIDKKYKNLKNFTIKTEQDFASLLINFFTFGLLNSRVIKVFNHDKKLDPKIIEQLRLERNNKKDIQYKTKNKIKKKRRKF